MNDLYTTHPNEEQTRTMLGLEGYTYLGYQNGWKNVYFDENGEVTEDPSKRKTFGYLTEDYPDYGKCVDRGHYDMTKEPHWHSKQHNSRGSNVTYWCPECKIFWKVDMSD